MRHYETTIIIAPDVGEEGAKEAITSIETELKERFEGENIVVSRWGKKPLAYPIRKFNEGFYGFYEYDSSSKSTVPGLEARLRMNEKVIRFLTVRRDEEMKSEARMKERYAKKRKLNEGKNESRSESKRDFKSEDTNG